ncbi:MAG: ABC transporter ATP-binding protein [Candidatus Cryosericum sp.]|jgi:putative ABC transport system ATP-binding protein|nr:ABC transporter ATP-binding protein [Candidatus Cryosericum sp.]HPS70250.1 ABC transporter ATP-binding protein [Candidatus Cryosericum sp.]
MIQLSKVQKVYDGTRVKVQALQGVDLMLEHGDYVSIRGRSGSGKTTLLNIVGTLDTPTGGEVLYDGIDPFTFKDAELSRFRNHKIGFVFQEFELLPELTVLDNVALVPRIGGVKKKEAQRLAAAVLEQVDMKDRMQHYPSELSGGEKQRVAVARAIVNDPEIVLCDEPTGELDEANVTAVMQVLDDLNRSGKTLLVVTHSDEVAEHAHRRMYMVDGVLHEAA